MPQYNSMVVFRSQVEKRKKFARKRIIGVSISILVIIGFWALIRYSQPMNLFTLQHIRFIGQHRVNIADVKRTLGLRQGASLFSLNLRLLESKVEKMTWVKSVRISRTLPDNLMIEIEEYNPTAVLLKDVPYLVSSEGHLLPPAPTGYVVNLPVITNYTGILPKFGTKIPDARCIDAVAVLAEMKQYKLYGRVSEVRFINSFTYRLFIDDGRIELLLGKKRRESISAVENFLKTIPGGVNWLDVAYIDARSPGFIALNNQSLRSVMLGNTLTDKDKLNKNRI